MSDFSDRPFVAGSLTGLRAFKVDGLGRLTGVTHAHIFKPGENVAECKGKTDPITGWMATYLRNALTSPLWNARTPLSPPTLSAPSMFTSTTVQWGDEVEDSASSDEEPEPEPPPHTTAGVDCTCGYYAYFDGVNTYADEKTVTGLIEGYGVCTVGRRGFRAEKARLVALVDPTHKPWRKRRLSELYVPAWFWLALGLFTLATATASLLRGHWISLGIQAVSLVIDAWMLPHARKAGRRRKGTRSTARLQENYPDVPIYRTLKAALSAHPLTVPPAEPAPTPDTHADFWDMEVPR